ncbi:MAG: hypothetical protein GXP22_10700 [Gammaproteobacteria bacterium]|nr:hypothetical protein [Gammaproteobacteria bacterium]
MQANHEPNVIIECTYQSVWRDGFGARGWKINQSIGDPVVIASTAESGTRIPTSVFVHDIVDHHLCGLKLSGHRNEATALLLLQQRTQSNPASDFEQLINEDIIQGYVNGESMIDFLPQNLRKDIPLRYRRDDKLSIGFLCGLLGEAQLRKELVQHFFQMGHDNRKMAIKKWNKTGLDYSKRENIGLSIQRLLSRIDPVLLSNNPTVVHGQLHINSHSCQLEMDHSFGSISDHFINTP